MPLPLFVYGTLKEGFCNFELNKGRRIPGQFETVSRYLLYVLGELSLPWLVDARGEGTPVRGQLFEVSDQLLTELDLFERVGEPGWLTRHVIQVRAIEPLDAPVVSVFVYLGDPDAPAVQTVHLGPIAEYTAEMDDRYGDA